MAFGITGYLLEPPRVGAGNSIYTPGPDNVITDAADWNAAYPVNESNPADDYLVLVVDEGTGKLPTARFGWTRNDLIPRFDYDAQHQRFWPMPGAPADDLGTLTVDSNTNRIQATKPRTDLFAIYPVRVSLSAPFGSGLTMVVVVVDTDLDFTASPGPVVGSVELSMTTGNLNWADADLAAYQGRTVSFQRQTPRAIGEVSGALGNIEDMLLMAPIPATGQTPLIRIGSRRWWIGVQVPNEAAFTSPAMGTFQWALDTGRLKFHPSDVAALTGSTVFMDGILVASDLGLVGQVLGTCAAPTPLPVVPPEGGDIIVRLISGGDVYQMRNVTLVDAFTSVQAPDVQIRKSDGVFQFNSLQTALRGTWQLVVTVCDLPIEHGVSMRMFRSPVDLQATRTTIKDVASLYEASGATFASPIIGSPQVFLPAQPIEDLPMTVKVEQGTGFFTSDNLPDLRQTTPSGSRVIGYLLDLGEGLLQYAQRRNDYIISRPQDSGSAQLPDPYVQDFNRTLEMEQTAGMGDWQPIDFANDAWIEPFSGVVTFADTAGDLLASGDDASISGTTLTAPTAAFTSALVNKWLVLPTVGAVYGIVAVLSPTMLVLDASGVEPGPVAYQVRQDAEILADRYFEEIILDDPDTKVERILLLGPITNAPRYNLPLDWIRRIRFRYASGGYSTSVTVVTGVFTDPALMASGTVEVNETSGATNFAQADVTAGGNVYWMRQLKQGVDYKVTAALGLFEFTERFFSDEEGLITYKPSDSNVFVEEAMHFLIRKELTPPRSVPASVIAYNLAGRTVASDVAPAVYRGGRPQTTAQAVVSTTNSTITFQQDSRLDGLLPHGPVVGPNENIYVDYYVLNAVGGEKTVSVLRPPMVMAQVVISADETSFEIVGNWTAKFKANRVLRIDQGEVHLIQAVAYADGKTTVTISSGEVFRDDWTAPGMAQASGPTRVTGLLFQRAYFTTDLGRFNPVARGMNKIVFEGLRTGDYQSGTILRITDGADVEVALVLGSSYDSDTDATQVALATNVLRQYVWGLVNVQRSTRPIVDASSTTVQTSRVPVSAGDPTIPESMQNVQVFRKVDDAPGELLDMQTGYYMDPSGRVTFFEPLGPDEQWGIFYTGHAIIEAGRRIRASYVSIITPDFVNGLAGQSLVADYWTFAPDSFYYRVVKISAYRLELAAKYAKAARESAPSGGPILSNASSPFLREQGSPSPFYFEGVYANDDVVTRYLLKFYNDVVNTLEDVLQGMDGRIVGGRDGRILFDGNIDNPQIPLDPNNPLVWASVTNQIDDLIKIADAPYQITFSFPNFSIEPYGTYISAYLPSAYSRFYPTWRRRFGVTGLGVQTGDPVLDTGSTNLTSVQSLRTRLAWAQVTMQAAAGTTVLFVDNAEGDSVGARPIFRDGMLINVQDREGNPLVTDVDAISIVGGGVAATSLTLDAALPLDIPAGATIWRSSNDTSGTLPEEVITTYMQGRDFFYDPKTGQILYVVPYPPFDGTNPLVPPPLEAHPLPAALPLSLEVTLSNADLAPEKIPALYGGLTDDDGEYVLPLVSPDLECEAVTLGSTAPGTYGLLPQEIAYIEAGGLLRTATTAPYERTGSLDGTRTVITVFPVLPIAPKRYDLVRIVSGLNGETSFHRISTATANSITVEHPFAIQDAGFTCVVATSNSLGTGFGTFAIDTLTDVGAFFQTWGVQPGDTVVIEDGLGAGKRLQVTTVQDETTLLFAQTLTIGTVTGNYRITNPLSTFGSFNVFTGTSTLDRLITVVAKELQIQSGRSAPPINAEVKATEAWFDLVFTYLTSRIGGSVTLGGTTFTDAGADFEADGVAVGDVIYIRSGLLIKGVYQVNAVSSSTTLEVDQPFPDSASGVTYKVGRPYGASFIGLEAVMETLRLLDEIILQTTTFLMLLWTPVDVIITGGVQDPNAFARALRTQDLTLRDAVVSNRINDLESATGPKEAIVQELVADFLYDKRYAWLDARINRQTGLLTLKNLATQQRLEAQANAVMQMVKLLSMGTP